MKNVLTVLAIATLPLLGFSQSVFDKFETMENVGAVIVNKSMISLMASIGDMSNEKEAGEFAEMAKGLKGVRVFATEDKGASTNMKATVRKYLNTSKLEELMRVKDKDMNVRFYVKNGKKKDHVTELLMFVSGIKELDMNGRKFETVLVSMTGDIDLTKIGSLTKKMNLPDELNKANGE